MSFTPYQTPMQTQVNTQNANNTQNQLNPSGLPVLINNQGNDLQKMPTIQIVNVGNMKQNGKKTSSDSSNERPYVPVGNFSQEPKPMVCPYCKKNIVTITKKSTNMKALLIAIGTCYCGFAVMQACNNKSININDCEHSCPKCGNIIGTYYAV